MAFPGVMFPSFRPLLALPLALPLLACEPGTSDDPQFRSINASESVATARLGLELPSVRVTSYSVGSGLEDALDAEGFDALLAGAEGIAADAPLVLRLDGVVPLVPGDVDEAFVQLRRDDEVLDYPYRQFKFQVDFTSTGRAVTELVFDASSQDDDDDYQLWHDDVVVAAPPIAEPIETIVYEVVAADGTSTTCRAEVQATEPLGFGYTQIENATGRFEFEVADDCAEVLQAAADNGPPEAFFVRCDAATTTAGIGMHGVGSITLKRGVIHAVGELFVEHVAD